jgi:hypothetical protein
VTLTRCSILDSQKKQALIRNLKSALTSSIYC